MTVTAKANAKINLLLKIDGREPNGWHTLKNIMQSVSLYDDVSVRFTEGGGIKAASNLTELGGVHDITYNAAKVYEDMTGIKVNAEISVKKNIPVAAGLGGGSADAAAVLLILNGYYKKLNGEQLECAAAKVGSDVPFFLTGGTALCTHYGEKTEKLPDMPDCSIVISKAGKKPSTEMMYSLIDGVEIPPFKPSVSEMLDALDEGDLEEISDKCGNVFEYVWHDTEMDEVRRIMKRCGALNVILSGSGPSLFAIFDSPAKASSCLKALNGAEHPAFICSPTKKAIVID